MRSACDKASCDISGKDRLRLSQDCGTFTTAFSIGSSKTRGQKSSAEVVGIASEGGLFTALRVVRLKINL